MQLRIFTEPQQGAGYATLLSVWAYALEDGNAQTFTSLAGVSYPLGS
jgi:hypothetical protein